MQLWKCWPTTLLVQLVWYKGFGTARTDNLVNYKTFALYFFKLSAGIGFWSKLRMTLLYLPINFSWRTAFARDVENLCFLRVCVSPSFTSFNCWGLTRTPKSLIHFELSPDENFEILKQSSVHRVKSQQKRACRGRGGGLIRKGLNSKGLTRKIPTPVCITPIYTEFFAKIWFLSLKFKYFSNHFLLKTLLKM